jgi:hypothetical protein
MYKLLLLIAIFLFFLTSCLTYDKPLMYKRNYDQGKNQLLRFDGFYSDTITRKVFGRDYYYTVDPVYFYSDGSVLIGSTARDTNELRTRIENKIQFGQWGNYRVTGDSILIETFGVNGGSGRMERFFKAGIILNNRLFFGKEIDRKGEAMAINEDIRFVHSTAKPDSSQNWIRYKKKYNR